MSPERKLRSIPPRTFRNVWRERGNQPTLKVNSIEPAGVSFRGTRIGGTGQEQPRQTKAEQEWVNKHVFRKPIAEKLKVCITPYEDERIEWQTEIIEDYNTRGDLGIILQFIGIDLTHASFVKSNRNYGPNSVVVYSPVGHRNKVAFLILSTFTDIFEAQVVPVKKDINPFFQREIYLPGLTNYDVTTMTVQQNNNLIVVSYRKK